jgi:hypothetical protein
MDRLTRSRYLFRSSKYNVEFPFKGGESLFEIVSVGSTGRNVHVDQTKPAGCLLAGEENRVSVPHYSDV